MSADEETFTAGSGLQIARKCPGSTKHQVDNGIPDSGIVWLRSSSSATLTSADRGAAGIAAFGPGTGGTSAPTITSANSANFAVNAAGSFTVTTTGYPNPTRTRAPSPCNFQRQRQRNRNHIRNTRDRDRGHLLNYDHRQQRRGNCRYSIFHPHCESGTGDHQCRQHHLCGGYCRDVRGNNDRIPNSRTE